MIKKWRVENWYIHEYYVVVRVINLVKTPGTSMCILSLQKRQASALPKVLYILLLCKVGLSFGYKYMACCEGHSLFAGGTGRQQDAGSVTLPVSVCSLAGERCLLGPRTNI